jgi:hypothetical protein
VLRLAPLPFLLSAVLAIAGCGGGDGAVRTTRASAAPATTAQAPPTTSNDDLGVSEPEIETSTTPRTTPKPSTTPAPSREAGDQNQNQGSGNRNDEGAGNGNDRKARAIERCRADRAQQPAQFRTRYGSGPRGLAACVVDRAARDVAAGQGNG